MAGKIHISDMEVIDDIDRLCDEEIREMFQLVKSIADFKNTIYTI